MVSAVPPSLTDVRRRQIVGRYIHELWTDGGSDLSGLAFPIFDGRLVALGRYVAFQDDDADHAITRKGSSPSIDRVQCEDMTYDTFIQTYMYPNRPVVIDGLAENWQAGQEWVQDVGEARIPNIAFLRAQFGSERAPVYEQQTKGFGPTRPQASDSTIAEYCDWWTEQATLASETVAVEKESTLYLKDWKFLAAHPKYNLYEWPHYFRDDWLNQAMGNAYKFVYLGPKGTSTVLHADVLQSFSWSTNVCGKKRWFLIPPEYTYLLYDCFGKKLASHLHADVDDGMKSFFPGLQEARRHAVRVDQEAGETIFVPSKWYHTVENLEDTLSINHNWLNGANIGHSWDRLCIELAEVRPSRLDAGMGSEEIKSTEEICCGNSQIGDDLVLLWHVVTRKVLAVRNIIGASLSNQTISDIDAILPVLLGMQKLLFEGRAPELLQFTEFEIDEHIQYFESLQHLRRI